MDVLGQQQTQKSPQGLRRAGFLYFTGHIRIIIWWSWRPCNTSFNALIIKCINDLYLTLRCNRGIKKVLRLKISHILNVMTSGEELNS